MFTAAAASAQQSPSGQDGPRGQTRQHFMEMRGERFDRLKTMLQLRPDQDAAFQAFKAAMTPPERAPGEWRKGGAEDDLTTPQMLDRREQRMAEMKARFDRTKAATLTFYAALSPQQQKAFDVISRRDRMGGDMRGGMGPGMRFRGMDGHRDGRRDGPGEPPEDGPPPPPPSAG
jgi:hypothetical protein